VKLLTEEVLETQSVRDPASLPLEAVTERLESEGYATFGVRVLSVGRPVDRMAWERLIGAAIKRKLPALKVDLERPDVWVVALVGADCVHVGFLKYRPAARFTRPRMLFHSSAAMEARLALTMINLSRVRRGGIVLDPFCGVGGILLEAARLGIHVAGGDISEKLARRALENLKWAGSTPIGLAVADVTRPPYVRADGMVCDPPYGRSAPLFGKTLEEVYAAMYDLALAVLPRGGYLVSAIPHYAFGKLIPRGDGLKLLEKYEVTVHGALKRVSSLFRRE
jgi:tRNA (guanine10-N2)-dimethyltransferase